MEKAFAESSGITTRITLLDQDEIFPEELIGIPFRDLIKDPETARRYWHYYLRHLHEGGEFTVNLTAKLEGFRALRVLEGDTV